MRAGSSGSRRVTVWLWPLSYENGFPVNAADFAAFVVFEGLWAATGHDADAGWLIFPIAGVVIVAHVVQMAFATVRFDDDGMTIRRPWRRRRRIPWTDVAGVAWTDKLLRGRRPLEGGPLIQQKLTLRVLSAGHPMVPAFSPALMVVSSEVRDNPDSARRGAVCMRRILGELKSHGVTIDEGKAVILE